MEDLLLKLIGKRVDFVCSNGSVVRGEIREIRGGVVRIDTEDARTGYVATDKISAVWEVKDAGSKPGFVG